MDTFSPIMDQMERMFHDLMQMLPGFVIGTLVFTLFYFLSKRVQWAVNALMQRSGRSYNAALILGRLAQWGVALFGLLIALTIMLPSFKPAQLIELLGISGVAIGFAFRDILQNFLAGILILLTEPFKIGDQIVVGDYEGTVENILTRATYIKTYDGRRVVIPNATLFTESVMVNTAFVSRRSQYDIGIGYGDDIGQAKALILQAMLATEGVLHDPTPDVLVVDLAESSVNIRARWWSQPSRADVLIVQDKVIANIKHQLNQHGIDLPFPTRQILFHDQTEETDGDRARQREGWPVGKSTTPQPHRISDAILKQQGKAPKL